MKNVSAERTARRVAKNSLAQFINFAAISISKFLVVVAIARWSGVEEVGDYSFVITFTMTLSFLNHWGMVLLLVREIAQQRERLHEYVGNALTLGLGMGLLSVIAMGMTVALLGYSNAIVVAVYIAAFAMVLDTLGNLLNAAFGGFERMELGALAIVVQEVAFLIAGLAVLFLQLPLVWIFVVFVLSRLTGFIASAGIYWRLWGPPRFRFDPSTMKLLVRKTLPFGVNFALSPIFARVDVLLLSYFRGNVEVGYYVVASSLFYRLGVLARMFNHAMMPLVAREYALTGPAVVRYVRRAVKYQVVLALPLTVGALVLGDKIITFIFGAGYELTVFAFQIMASVTLLRFLDNTLGLTLTSVNREGRRSLATGTMGVFNFVLNLIVLPRYGFIGAAVTSVITEIGYFILLFVFVLERIPNPIERNTFVRPALASMFMAIPLLLFRELPLLLLLPLGFGVYAAAALVLRVLSAEELEFLLRVAHLQDRVSPSLRRLLLLPATSPDLGREQAAVRSDSP